MEVPSSDNETLVGSNLGFERVAVTTVLPSFSGISISDVEKLTTGASSSLIWTSKETSEESATLEILFPSSSVWIAKAMETVSIFSSSASSIPVNVKEADWDPAGIVIELVWVDV